MKHQILDLEALLRVPYVEPYIGPDVSPDGGWLAYVFSEGPVTSFRDDHNEFDRRE